MLVTGTRADTCGTKHHHRGRGGGMGTACKDTVRSSVVPSAALYPKRHYHHRRCLAAIREVLRRPPSPRKKKKKTQNVTRSPFGFGVRGEWVDSVSGNDEIFNVNSEVAAWTSKSSRVSPRSYMRCEGLTKVGHEADNCDIQKNQKKNAFKYFDNAAADQLISNIPPQHPR
jgi:hypothetical protein